MQSRHDGKTLAETLERTVAEADSSEKALRSVFMENISFASGELVAEEENRKLWVRRPTLKNPCLTTRTEMFVPGIDAASVLDIIGRADRRLFPFINTWNIGTEIAENTSIIYSSRKHFLDSNIEYWAVTRSKQIVVQDRERSVPVCMYVIKVLKTKSQFSLRNSFSPGVAAAYFAFADPNGRAGSLVVHVRQQRAYSGFLALPFAFQQVQSRLVESFDLSMNRGVHLGLIEAANSPRCLFVAPRAEPTLPHTRDAPSESVSDPEPETDDVTFGRTLSEMFLRTLVSNEFKVFAQTPDCSKVDLLYLFHPFFEVQDYAHDSQPPSPPAPLAPLPHLKPSNTTTPSSSCASDSAPGKPLSPLSIRPGLLPSTAPTNPIGPAPSPPGDPSSLGPTRSKRSNPRQRFTNLRTPTTTTQAATPRSLAPAQTTTNTTTTETVTGQSPAPAHTTTPSTPTPRASTATCRPAHNPSSHGSFPDPQKPHHPPHFPPDLDSAHRDVTEPHRRLPAAAPQQYIEVRFLGQPNENMQPGRYEAVSREEGNRHVTLKLPVKPGPAHHVGVHDMHLSMHPNIQVNVQPNVQASVRHKPASIREHAEGYMNSQSAEKAQVSLHGNVHMNVQPRNIQPRPTSGASHPPERTLVSSERAPRGYYYPQQVPNFRPATSVAQDPTNYPLSVARVYANGVPQEYSREYSGEGSFVIGPQLLASYWQCHAVPSQLVQMKAQQDYVTSCDDMSTSGEMPVSW
mmetsp:Transcript_20947/g.35954  ORF Transcript_20947/g.35954 Transcript_20947/m.35954 type:complete len:741 (+) Transcript_20947:78-2300(+)